MANFLPRLLGAAFVSCLAASPMRAQGVWLSPQEPCDPDTRGPTRAAEQRLGDAAEADDPDDRAKKLEEAADKKQAYEDVLWALINTKEFLFTH